MEIIDDGPAKEKKSRYWPLYQLQTDQSVLFRQGEYLLSSLRGSIAYAQRTHGRRFTTRKQPGGGIRVWRIDGSKWSDMKPRKEAA